MPRRKRQSPPDHLLAEADELDDARVGRAADEVGLFASDYGRFQRSRSELPPPMATEEHWGDGARRR